MEESEFADGSELSFVIAAGNFKLRVCGSVKKAIAKNAINGIVCLTLLSDLCDFNFHFRDHEIHLLLT